MSDVTQVVYGFTWQEWPLPILKCLAVSPDLNPFTFTLEREQSVSIDVQHIGPEPASSRLENLREESGAFVLRNWALHTPDYTTNYTEYIGKQLMAVLK